MGSNLLQGLASLCTSSSSDTHHTLHSQDNGATSLPSDSLAFLALYLFPGLDCPSSFAPHILFLVFAQVHPIDKLPATFQSACGFPGTLLKHCNFGTAFIFVLS